jgi:spore germination protein YaaH
MAVHIMMTTPATRAAHLNDLEQLLFSHPEFDGIDVDYESLMATDRDNYSAFMEDLSVIVHSQNKLLTTAVHTKAGPGTWYGPQAQDYQRIGNAVDEMLIMTYDLHWATSPTFSNPPPTAGCQSTSDWMNDVAAFAISEIDDPSKIQLGLPFYGYRWKHLFENHTLNDAGVGLTAQDAQELITTHNVSPSSIYRDPNGNEPHFIIDINGTNWVCYYQDGESIETKLESLDEYDLRDYIGGIGIWRLGGETDEMWEAITQSLNNSSATVNTNFDCTINSGTNAISSTEN